MSVIDTVARAVSGTASRIISRSSRPIIIVTGVMLIIFGSTLSNYESRYLVLIGAFILTLGVSFEFLVYLQESRRKFLRDRAYYERQYSRAAVTGTDASLKVLDGALSKITLSEISTVAQITELHSRITSEQHLSSIRLIAAKTQKRLAEEVNALGSRANLQLIIGIFISMAGLGVLGYFVFTIPPDLFVKGNEIEFIGYFFTRLSLVVFIEIFAYFFLRLYRYSIFEIKHFQNEMTNAEFRVMALETVLLKGDESTIKKICEQLSKTERNFLLKRGEKTITQALLDSEAERDKSMATMVESVVKNVSQTLRVHGGGEAATKLGR